MVGSYRQTSPVFTANLSTRRSFSILFNGMSDRIIVGLSGGVDSSVATLLLKREHAAIETLFMKNWEEDDDADYCAAAEDLRDAEAVASQLGVTLHRVNFAFEYWERVFSYFLSEYRAGRTPNPDVMCNKEIKFRAFLEYALTLGAERIATGHYARVDQQEGRFRLLKGRDPNKDQSYFLHTLDQFQLSHARFPLGEYHKSEVRKIASEAGLPTHAKPDSTGICFIGERRFRDFLARYLPAQPGLIEDDEGRVIGEHQGLMYHTIGQRQGLGIGGRKEGSDKPWYVAGKQLDRNVLIVVQGQDHPMLFSRTVEASQLHWIGVAPTDLPFRCSAKIRYRQPDQPCQIVELEGERARVEFDQPQRAVTSGQAIVFYGGDSLASAQECLGGGVIEAGTR